jgi:hypothetical protein
VVQPGQQTVGTLPRDDFVIGRECFGMARQLFDAEQLATQWRLARAWTQARISGLPALKAQWQSLHVLLAFDLDAGNQLHRRKSFHLATAGLPFRLWTGRIKPNSAAGCFGKACRKDGAALAALPRQEDAPVPGKKIWGVTPICDWPVQTFG